MSPIVPKPLACMVDSYVANENFGSSYSTPVHVFLHNFRTLCTWYYKVTIAHSSLKTSWLKWRPDFDNAAHAFDKAGKSSHRSSHALRDY